MEARTKVMTSSFGKQGQVKGEISGSHSGIAEDLSYLRNGTVLLGKFFPAH